MRNFLNVFVLIPILGISQTDATALRFDTKYYDAVDKWVAFPKMEGDTTYMFGFIYIDEQAGFTFDFTSHFLDTEDGLKKLPRQFEAGIKSRLARNTIDVAVLSADQIAELDLPKEPEWLAEYKRNSEEPEYLRSIGFHYNAVGASYLALAPLLKAYERKPHLKGLEFELSYAYNALQEYNKAITVLEKALENEPQTFWFYRELGFSYKNLGQVEKAEGIYRTGMELTTDNAQKAEMAINMAQSYALLRNERKFREWADLTREYCEKGSIYEQYLDTWAKEFDEEKR